MTIPEQAPSEKRLCYWTAHELLEGYNSKKITPVDVIKDCLLQIQEHNPTYNCVCHLEEESTLLKLAQESADRYAAGNPQGKLDGIPITIKDLMFVKGMPTKSGSMLPITPPDHPFVTPSVIRVLEQNAIILAKVTTSDYGWKAITECERTGITRNPYNSNKITGGSSGGSACSVALGFAPLSLGTDAGGSVRIPGGFCGVSAIKPTIGIIPHAPASVFGSLSTVGCFARDSRDVGLLMDVVAKTSDEDWLSNLPGRRETLTEDPYSRLYTENDVKGLKIAVSLNLGGYVRYVHPEILAAIKKAAESFEKLGAIVTYVDETGDLDTKEFEIYKTYKALWLGAAAQILQGKMKSYKMSEEEISKIVDPGLYHLAKLGEKYAATDVLAGEHTRAHLGIAMNKFHKKYDIILAPNCTIPPFDVKREVPDNVKEIATGPGKNGWDEAEDLQRFWCWTPFSYFFNMTKQPGQTIPVGIFSEEKTPIGMQVVGAMYREDLVIKACNAFQTVTEHHKVTPLPSGPR